jgi:hypothetical protein
MKDRDFQQRMVDELRNGTLPYPETSIYTILLELVQGCGMDEVVTTLHGLASDLDRRKELEELFDLTKTYEWS